MPASNVTTAKIDGTITTAQIQVRARELDFVTSFQRNWEALQEVMGITRPIEMQPGTILKSKYAVGTLKSGAVAEGEVIPFSQYEVKEKPYEDIDVEKFGKAVTLESVKKYGYDVAVGMTDDEFLVDLQDHVQDKFYTRLKDGSLKFSEKTFQMAIAMAIGKVKSKFKKIHRSVTGITVWVNTLDLYAYLGNAEITTQTAFGFTYVENFLGADKVFISDEIERGTVIATPMNNIVAYHVNPADSDFAKMGLVYTTDGVTNLIGFAVTGNYNRAQSESYALMGLRLFAEYEDAIAIVTINPDVEDKDTASSLDSEIDKVDTPESGE